MEDGIEQYMSLLNDLNSIKQKNLNKNNNNIININYNNINNNINNNNNIDNDKNNINKNIIINKHEPFSWSLKDS
jgi:hypothetical protein